MKIRRAGSDREKLHIPPLLIRKVCSYRPRKEANTIKHLYPINFHAFNIDKNFDTFAGSHETIPSVTSMQCKDTSIKIKRRQLEVFKEGKLNDFVRKCYCEQNLPNDLIQNFTWKKPSKINFSVNMNSALLFGLVMVCAVTAPASGTKTIKLFLLKLWCQNNRAELATASICHGPIL